MICSNDYHVLIYIMILKVLLTPLLIIRQKLKKYDNRDIDKLKAMWMMRIRMVTSVCRRRLGCWYHNAIVATSLPWPCPPIVMMILIKKLASPKLWPTEWLTRDTGDTSKKVRIDIWWVGGGDDATMTLTMIVNMILIMSKEKDDDIDYWWRAWPI